MLGASPPPGGGSAPKEYVGNLDGWVDGWLGGWCGFGWVVGWLGLRGVGTVLPGAASL